MGNSEWQRSFTGLADSTASYSPAWNEVSDEWYTIDEGSAASSLFPGVYIEQPIQADLFCEERIKWRVSLNFDPVQMIDGRPMHPGIMEACRKIMNRVYGLAAMRKEKHMPTPPKQNNSCFAGQTLPLNICMCY